MLFAVTAAHLGLTRWRQLFNKATSPAVPIVAWAQAPTNTQHQIITGHTARIEKVVVGRLGNRDVIVSASNDAVRIWDEHGDPIGNPIIGHAGLVPAMAVGRLGGRDVMVTGVDGAVRIWDEHGDPIRDPIVVNPAR